MMCKEIYIYTYIPAQKLQGIKVDLSNELTISFEKISNWWFQNLFMIIVYDFK